MSNDGAKSDESDATTEGTQAASGPALHDAAWFAEQIGMSLDWVRHNTKRLPRHEFGRRVKFSDESVRIFLEQTAIVPVERFVDDPNSIMRTERSRAYHRRNRY